MTTTTTKPPPRARGAAPPPAEASGPLVTDHADYRTLVDRQDRLRAEVTALRERLAEAEAFDVPSALANGRPARPAPAGDLRRDLAHHEKAVAELAETIEAARVAASEIEAKRIAPARAAVAQQILGRRAADDADLAELAVIDQDFVNRGYRRPCLSGWEMLTSDTVKSLRDRAAAFVAALRQIVEVDR